MIPKFGEVITKILSSKFKYGFRIGSPIEIMKIRNYAKIINLELPKSDEELEKEIIAAGISIKGKIYFFNNTLFDELKSIIENIFKSGCYVIFLNKFIENNTKWLEINHITSESILKEILRKCKPDLYIGQNIITPANRLSEYDAIVSEIHRISEPHAIILFEEIINRLPYIPPEKIAWSLSISDDFVWISEGKYFRIKYFNYSPEDKKKILNFVAAECNEKGYASITDIPIEHLAEENYELSITALHSAIFNSMLKDTFFMNGKIITTSRNEINILTLLKSYCKDQNECLVTNMMSKAIELSGSANKQYSLIALYETMIRVDAHRFVAEHFVNFDIEKIDTLLDNVIDNKLSPIKKITTFSLFPTCGVSWNHYLLESYCYRFSKKYRLNVLNYNDKNVGIIAPINLSLSYNEMLSNVIANENIELTQEAVGEYLFTNGFTAKRKYSTMSKIIEKAKTIRNER